jgi:hypothetical protein
MQHFICVGNCEGMADQAGTCQAPDCSYYGKDLESCNCEDGAHTAIKNGEGHEHNQSHEETSAE